SLRAGLDREGLFGAGQSGKVEQHRHRAEADLRWLDHADFHRRAGRRGCVRVEALHAAEAAVLGERGEGGVGWHLHGAQYITTERIDSPLFISSKPWLMSSSFSLWVIRSCMLILPSMYQSTIFGTSVRPRAPPKAEPSHLRPVTSWNGRVL